jgi:lipoyl(octanoyl) transferase
VEPSRVIVSLDPSHSPDSWTQRWRLLHSAPATGAFNMALDHALMAHARATREWVLRVYSWREPTLSFGRNQRAAGAYDRERLVALGISVVRRPTGGRAILHHREVTYSVTAPCDDAGDLRESYARINRLLVSGLRTFGVQAQVVEHGARAQSPGLSPCFDHPSIGELVVGGRKLVGSAQWRCDGALLQHGSILIEDDQTMVASLTNEPLPAPPAPATLRDSLGYAPSVDEVANALFAAVCADAGDAAPLSPSDASLLVGGLEAQYQDPDWTWRR